MLLSTHGILASGGTQLFDTTSFIFDGVDDYMETNVNYTMLDNQQQFSISVWVKLNDMTTAQRIVVIWGGRRIFMYVRSTGVVDCTIRSSSYFIRSNTNAITLGNWHHIVWTYDGTQTRYQRYKLYVDGASNVASNAGSTSSVLQTFQELNVGLVSGRYLNANINELAIWKIPITPAEVLAIYNNGKANDLNNLPGGGAPPQNWWRSENATFNGTNWAVPDTNGLFPITTSNMGINSIVNDVP